MTVDETRVRAGQIWEHRDHGYEVVTTRVSEEHVHHDVPREAASQQKQAVDEFIEDEFGHSLVYVAVVGGGCKERAAFIDEFEYVRERERASYEE